jgi:membrane protein DedA with SNARE-associated domain
MPGVHLAYPSIGDRDHADVGETPMPHYLDGLAGSPWLLAVVVLVAGLDALLPFMPSESTVVAAAVLAAGSGQPNLVLLIAAASVGAFLGDVLSYGLGRRHHVTVAERLQRGRRSRAVHGWVHKVLHTRGAMVIVFARFLPGGRSATAFAAGVVGYPGWRFRVFTAIGVTFWATQSALLGYLGGAVFKDRPILGLLLAGALAMPVTSIAILIQRFTTKPSQFPDDDDDAASSASSTPVSRGPRNTGSRPDDTSHTAFTTAPRSRTTLWSHGPR